MTLAEFLEWATSFVGIGMLTYLAAEYLPFMGKIVNLVLKRLATIGLGLVILTSLLYLRIWFQYLPPFPDPQTYVEAVFPVLAEAFGLATIIHGVAKQVRGQGITRVLANVKPKD